MAGYGRQAQPSRPRSAEPASDLSWLPPGIRTETSSAEGSRLTAVVSPSAWAPPPFSTTRQAPMESPRKLRGLRDCVRLKIELETQLSSLLPQHWMRHVDHFLRAVGVSEVDEVALAALLADLDARLDLLLPVPIPTTVKSSHGGRLVMTEERPLAGCATLLRQFERRIAERVATAIAGSVLEGRTRRAVAFIEQHYAEPITVEEVARAVGCSRVNLSRLFKRETGVTVHRWLVWVRLRHAADELRKGEKIEAVVMLVGYRSKRAFMHQFRSCYGCSPGEFRQRLIDTIERGTRFPPITNAHPI
jgi:AraC-like DNA-binding protein